MRRNHLPLAPWLDIAGVALPLGQAIGRWANFVNQELYGTVTSLPWGIPIDRAHRVDAVSRVWSIIPVATTRFHPLFLYESLWNVLAFIVLLNIFLRNREQAALRRHLPALRDAVFVHPLPAGIPARGSGAHPRHDDQLVAGDDGARVSLRRSPSSSIASRTAPTVEEVEKQQPIPTSGKTSSKAA